MFFSLFIEELKIVIKEQFNIETEQDKKDFYIKFINFIPSWIFYIIFLTSVLVWLICWIIKTIFIFIFKKEYIDKKIKDKKNEKIEEIKTEKNKIIEKFNKMIDISEKFQEEFNTARNEYNKELKKKHYKV